MKRILITTFAATFVSLGFSQGLIDVGNNFGGTVFRAPIYGPEVPDDGVSKTGQSGSPAFPTGSTVYTGPRLQGTGYTFAFYASTRGITTDASSLSLIGTLPFSTTAGTAGFVITTTMSIPGVLPGNPTTWQIRAWSNFAPYFWGTSSLMNSEPLGGIGSDGPIPNPKTTGWVSFNIYYIPEPGTTVLAVMGASLLLLFRQR